MQVFGIPEEKIRCRLCEDKATTFRVGSLEVENDKVLSVRMFFLCDIHLKSENFEKSLD